MSAMSVSSSYFHCLESDVSEVGAVGLVRELRRGLEVDDRDHSVGRASRPVEELDDLNNHRVNLRVAASLIMDPHLEELSVCVLVVGALSSRVAKAFTGRV